MNTLLTLALIAAVPPQVVTVESRVRDCSGPSCSTSVSTSTGTIVGRYDDGSAVILTAAHCIDRNGALSVVSAGKRYAAVEVCRQYDEDEDISFLKTSLKVEESDCAELAGDAPAIGSEAIVCRFDRLRRERIQRSDLVEFPVVVSGVAIQGESGGAVVVGGKVVGVVKGHDKRATVYTTARRIIERARLCRIPCFCLKPVVPPIRIIPPVDISRPSDAELRARIAKLEQMVSELSKRSPVPGPQGPQGRPGRDGQSATNEPRKIHVRLIVKKEGGGSETIDEEAYLGTADDPVVLMFHESQLRGK